MIILSLIMAVLFAAAPQAGPRVPWVELEPGLEFARFSSRDRAADVDGDLIVVRLDVRRLDLRVLAATHTDDGKRRNARLWCEDFGLLAAINAGMYQADRRTHVGFLQVGGEVHNRFANEYLSAAGFDPVDPSDPPFRLFDLDVTPLRTVRGRYRTVVQNLRLIKRGGENRWEPAADRWREAALGEDSQGRALLIFCSTAWSMQEFNEILLGLPLAVECAQHLEGGNPAQLWLAHPAVVARDQGSAGGAILPNVLGVSRRRSAGD